MAESDVSRMVYKLPKTGIPGYFEESALRGKVDVVCSAKLQEGRKIV